MEGSWCCGFVDVLEILSRALTKLSCTLISIHQNEAVQNSEYYNIIVIQFVLSSDSHEGEKAFHPNSTHAVEIWNSSDT
jgi:hypothetical protein